ncbi:HAMP domain-containing sensor histidine kinase [Craurococcus roseus]|uniref:histidine kinase n=1 Tax=Craurococcus roseus TaxID=77585 RepID=A0ABN1FYX5_9PROT
MSIALRVRLLQAAISAAILAMAAMVYYAMWSTDYYQKRVKWTNHELAAISALKSNANRFAEQIAEFLLIGEPERPDLLGARAELEAGFGRVEGVIRGEFGFLKGRQEGEEDLDGLHRLDRMRTLYQEINVAVAHASQLREEGRQDEAILLFRREIENRLDVEFDALLTGAILDEEEEVRRTERRADELWHRLALATAIVTLMAIAASLVSGMLIARSLRRPIMLLADGTEAVAQGRLDHRIDYDGRDELGTLARRFNAMAATQEEQRKLLLGARSELERQVAERTAELAAANKRLTDINKLRIRFLADISHELRTPLTVLRGEAEIALRHGPKPETVYCDTLERIVAQASDMTRLVEDLLFISRSETDTLRFEMRPTVLPRLVAEAVREVEVLRRRNRLTIEAKYPPWPMRIEADPQRFKQAVTILLDNAVKYSPAGRAVTVEVAAADGHAEISVRNEGEGIPAEELPHVFDRSYRGRAPHASSQQGSGLGLAIARWLVEKHGGEIAIISGEGRFTEVRLRVPMAEAASDGEDSDGRGRPQDSELRQTRA